MPTNGSRHIQSTAPRRRMQRRSFLGTALIGTAGLALNPGRAGAAWLAGASVRPSPIAGGRPSAAEIGARVAEEANPALTVWTSERLMATTPDGCLPTSVQGKYAGGNGHAFVVLVGEELRPIEVAVTPVTPIYAAGELRYGDLSGCKPGDNVFAATAFSPLGMRVAGWMESNLGVYWGNVTSIAGSVLTCAITDYYGWLTGDTLDIRLMPMTEYLPTPPNVGDRVYCVTTTELPSYTAPGAVWARTVCRLVPNGISLN